jgi:hypothetical protein
MRCFHRRLRLLRWLLSLVLLLLALLRLFVVEELALVFRGHCTQQWEDEPR